MRKRFLLSLLVALLTTLSIHAYDFQSGDLYYNFTSDTTVEVTYKLYDDPTNYQGLTTATIPETVTYDGTTYSVTSIGGCAFWYCSSLASITIPTSVTSIGSSAFEYCSSLTSVTIPNSVTSIGSSAFCVCSSLTSITIPNSVTTIGNHAFALCSSLTSITIPNSVIFIGEAFVGCSSLTSIVVESGNTMYDSRENCNAIIETASNTLIAGCQSTIIPNSVTSIGSSAFYGCTFLTSLTIPNSVTSIGSAAFAYCFSLTSITLPNSVTTIGYTAFALCSSLTSITLPNSVTSIGFNAFYDCSSLTSVTSLSCTPPSCGSDVFNGTPSEKTLVVPSISMDAYKNSSTWKEFTSFESIVYPSITLHSSDSTLGIAQIDQDVDCDSVAIISATATPGCQFTQWSDGNTDNPRTIKLTQDTTVVAEFEMDYSGKCGDELYWAYSNQEIEITGTGAMYNYTDSTMPWTLLRDSIKTVRVGNNATSIGAYAFAACSSLTSISIPNSVTSIGGYAFGDCSSLADIYCYATTPPVCYVGSGYDSFLGVSKHCYIHVPAGSIRDYQMAVGWRDFYHFFEISELPDGAPTDQVGVTVTGNYATFSWPVNPTASSYTLTITKDGEVFCTLIFNNMGQLVGMAFAPARNGEQSANQDDAQSTAYGFSFVVTNLNANSHYTYTFTVNGADNEVIETYSGAFDTSEVTALSETEQENRPSRKIIRNGQVLILRNGETYDMMGQRM